MLIITGSMGSGKTTVLGECSDLLLSQGIPHAAIDLDTLATVHLPAGDPEVRLREQRVMYRNLRDVWANSAAEGVSQLLIAEAVEAREEVDAIREAVNASEMTICRLRVPLVVMQQRIRLREPAARGESPASHRDGRGAALPRN